jgi:hypothetical protein
MKQYHGKFGECCPEASEKITKEWDTNKMKKSRGSVGFVLLCPDYKEHFQSQCIAPVQNLQTVGVLN